MKIMKGKTEEETYPEFITENRESRLETYFLDEQVRPFFVICPGGGYKKLSYQKEGQRIKEWLGQLGYHSGIFCYPLNDIYPETYLKEIQETLNWLKEDKRISNVFVIGFSSGSHTAGLFGTSLANRPDGLILSYPVVTLTAPIAHKGCQETFLHHVKPTEQEQYSLENRIDFQTPPVFLWSTWNDPAVPIQNSLLLLDCLNHAGVSCESHLFPDGPHGLGLAQQEAAISIWPILAEKWIETQVKG